MAEKKCGRRHGKPVKVDSGLVREEWGEDSLRNIYSVNIPKYTLFHVMGRLHGNTPPLKARSIVATHIMSSEDKQDGAGRMACRRSRLRLTPLDISL